MKNEFFEPKMFNNLEAPIQKLMELNVKMMQNLSLMKPMDLLSLKKPEDIIERNMELFIQNSHMTLNYMRDTFHIIENHWFNVGRNMEQNTKKTMDEATSMLKKGTKKASHMVKTAAKKSTSTAKKAASSAKKIASSASKKASSTMKKASSTAKKASSSTKKAASTAKKAASPVKKTSIKKAPKAAMKSKSSTALKAKPASKSVLAKPNIMHSKAPMNQNAPKTHLTADSGIQKPGSLNEKSGTKDLGMQNLGNKSNTMPTSNPHR